MSERLYVILGIILLIIGLLLGVHDVISNLLSTGGIELDAMTSQLKKLKQENMLIRERVLLDSSFTNIASEASREGFTPATYIYIR